MNTYVSANTAFLHGDAGGPAAITLNSGHVYPNSASISWTDTGGTAQSVMGMDGANVIEFHTGAGSPGLVFRNQSNTLELARLDNSGNFQTSAGLIVLGSAQVNGNITCSQNVSVLNNARNIVAYTINSVPEHIEHGHQTCSGVPNGSSTNTNVGFTVAFNNNPIVICTVDTPSTGDIQNWHVAAQNVSTTAFQLRANNSSGSTGNVTVWWFAIGN